MDLSLIKQIRHFGSSITVLYVEDEQNVREQIYKMLQKLFDQVDVALDGQEAFEMYMQKNYDLIVTDLKMPRMDGVELCEKIIARNKEQKIILISAYREVEEILTLINIGISGFLTKPVDMHQMLEKVYMVVKNIYADKMMKYHYEEMKKKLLENVITSDDDLYYRDTLTSLHNQEYFLENIDNESTKWAILININDFKLINDYYSFAHGNHLLFQVAELLKAQALTYSYELFRLSNDEFVLLKKEAPTNCKEMESEANSIYGAIERQKYTILGVDNVTISVTMGVASSHNHLLECLYRALMYAKKHGLRYALYKNIEDDRESVKNIMEVKALLKSSIENSMIVPVYQPIRMRDGRVKYEVLMRIKSVDSDELIAPSYFLEIAKQHRYYNEISKMVIFKALEEMRHCNETFSINFSYIDMKNTEFMEELEQKIKEEGVGSRLIFEIIETEHLDSIGVALEFIERFRAYGVQIAIDDFGSGYSNFAHIFWLHPDFIKLDGSLIQKMLQKHEVHLFVETIIEFAHKLNIEVIAEFVSSQEIYDALKLLDVDAFQGYFIGKPQEVIGDEKRSDACK
ncbi:EAL domain-containing protein [Sulfurimonas sp.]|uniref:EAL domain-containing protein n=1 Tax=Sulfurimonas sp. TaxID=2022749 RepID=UPI003D10A510